MENYEEKYNKAIDVIKRIKEVNKDNVELVDFIEYNYPELKKSDDEKIRKGIIKSIIDLNTDWLELHGVTKENALAWLEKQKSMKTVIEVWKEMRLEVYAQATGNRHEPNYADDGTKLFSLNDIDEIIEKISEKQGEQKPTDKIESKFKVKYAGSEYNVLEVKNSAGITFYGIEDEPNHIDYVKAENCEIISGYAIKENGSPHPTKTAVFSEQKPAWSEEDERKFSDILTLLRGGENYHYNTPELFAWLKSIKDRFTWKPSDEMLEALYRAVPQNVKEMSEDEILLDKLYQGLKYSKDAYNCIKEHWKPSEEQMKRLQYAIRILKGVNEHTDAKYLEELFDDLKKL